MVRIRFLDPVIVLVHEAYHLRRWKWRRSEPKVECQAIPRFTIGARLLGATPEVANDLLPYALAAHARMIRLLRATATAAARRPVGAADVTMRAA